MNRILNLMYPEDSYLKFKISKFPDGQQDVKIITERPFVLNREDHVQIKARLNNFLDLELILAATSAIKRLGIRDISLNIPYFLGSRSDRQFEIGGSFYLKDVISPIINSQNYMYVSTYDAHSDVLGACINNYINISNISLVEYALKDILKRDTSLPDGYDNILLLSPDAGASKKIYKIADQIRYKEDVVICSKYRDENGKLHKVNVPVEPYTEKNIIIIDDICDGGRTFINIAEKLKNIEGFNGKIYLIVSHGIFSKGFTELNKHFDGIYTTDSYFDIKSDEFTFKNDNKYHKLKQFKL